MEQSLPGVLRQQAAGNPTAVALRHKEFGRWHELTWQEFDEHVQAVGYGLRDLGVAPGSRCAVISDNEPEWIIADLAVQAIGAWSIGIYPIQSSAEVEYILQHSGATVAFCGDQEQVDKVIEVRSHLPALMWIVCRDMKGVREYEDAMVLPFDDLVARGRCAGAAGVAGEWDEMLKVLDPDGPAAVGYTSGTTGTPKGALLSHRNITETARATAPIIKLDSTARVLAQFPLAHPTARNMDAYASIVAGASINFPESAQTVGEALYEIAPTFMTGTPRVYESIAATIQIRVQKASWFKRTAFNIAMATLESVLERQLAGKQNVIDRLRAFLAHLAVARWVTDGLGLRKLRFAACGGAATSPELLKFFTALGVNVYEVYGQTETAGLVFCQRGLDDIGTAGYSVGDVESKIDEHGELLLRGTAIFNGYLDDAAKTAVALADGWYHTGDIARIDELGRLIMLDRDKAIIHSSDGDLSPSEIENKLKFSPFIREAMVVGEQASHLGALVQIEFETCADWAQRRNLPYTTFRSLSSLPEIVELIRNEIEKANAKLPIDRRLADFRLLPKELDPDDDEITPSFKVKREVVSVKFAGLIDEMFQTTTPVTT